MWWFKKNNDKLKELDQRLTHNSKVLEEDHHDLMELKVENAALKERIEALELKIATLENDTLRLSKLPIAESDDPNNVIIHPLCIHPFGDICKHCE